MRKIELQIKETLKYARFMTVEFENDISDKQLNNLLSSLERKAFVAEDISYMLEKMDGVKIIENVDSDLSSPDSIEIEIIDYNDLTPVDE